MYETALDVPLAPRPVFVFRIVFFDFGERLGRIGKRDEFHHPADAVRPDDARAFEVLSHTRRPPSFFDILPHYRAVSKRIEKPRKTKNTQAVAKFSDLVYNICGDHSPVSSKPSSPGKTRSSRNQN